MKRKLLLFLFIGSFAASADAQRKDQKTTAYAITAAQKGSSSWTEVRLIDVNTGEVLKTIYGNKDEVPTLNARTKKPVVKKEISKDDLEGSARTMSNIQFATKDNLQRLAELKGGDVQEFTVDGNKVVIRTKVNGFATGKGDATKREVIELRGDVVVEDISGTTSVTKEGRNIIINKFNVTDARAMQDVKERTGLIERKIVMVRGAELNDKPFSTTSAAIAYDKKHERLYYTPMGINELRYIDLKSKTPSIYYFENEAFGALSSRHDVPNQVTRMVIGSDGNGYALTNNAKHLIRFTTDKKATVTDLGALTDDPANGKYSIHNSGNYGGDMVADEKNGLYLLTANRSVYKISLDTKVASYVGSIKGLPREFSTNGAVVDKGTDIIVSSANSTLGYYRFNLETLQAEKISADGAVFNASDLANGNLVSVKKKKEVKNPEPIVEEQVTATASETERNEGVEVLQSNRVSVYPNPVNMGGVVKLSFRDQPKGLYTIQFMDIAGKLISSKQVNVTNRMQVEDYKLPDLTARGNYLLKVVSDAKKVVSVNKIVVQ